MSLRAHRCVDVRVLMADCARHQIWANGGCIVFRMAAWDGWMGSLDGWVVG